jgi:hypothetical protein
MKSPRTLIGTVLTVFDGYWSSLDRDIGKLSGEITPLGADSRGCARSPRQAHPESAPDSPGFSSKALR